MSERSEKALKLFYQGYNCAQSVLAPFGDVTGLDEKTAFAVLGGFGGGVCTGELCGAITGGAAAISAIKPFADCTRPEDKIRIGGFVRRFTESFRAEFGDVVCRALRPGADVDPVERKRACAVYIARAVELVEALLEEILA